MPPRRLRASVTPAAAAPTSSMGVACRARPACPRAPGPAAPPPDQPAPPVQGRRAEGNVTQLRGAALTAWLQAAAGDGRQHRRLGQAHATCRPNEAATWAMPAPICPAPTTPSRAGSPRAMLSVVGKRRACGAAEAGGGRRRWGACAAALAGWGMAASAASDRRGREHLAGRQRLSRCSGGCSGVLRLSDTRADEYTDTIRKLGALHAAANVLTPPHADLGW